MDDESYEETVNIANSCMGSYCHTTKNRMYISLPFSLYNKALSDYCDKGLNQCVKYGNSLQFSWVCNMGE